MKSLESVVKQNILGVIATMGIAVLSLAPIPEQAPLSDVPFIDKWVHFVMYGGVTAAMWIDRRGRFSWWSIAWPVILGGLMELAQACTGYRSGDWMDFWADDFGVLLATLVCSCSVWCRKR